MELILIKNNHSTQFQFWSAIDTLGIRMEKHEEFKSVVIHIVQNMKNLEFKKSWKILICVVIFFKQKCSSGSLQSENDNILYKNLWELFLALTHHNITP